MSNKTNRNDLPILVKLTGCENCIAPIQGPPICKRDWKQCTPIECPPRYVVACQQCSGKGRVMSHSKNASVLCPRCNGNGQDPGPPDGFHYNSRKVLVNDDNLPRPCPECGGCMDTPSNLRVVCNYCGRKPVVIIQTDIDVSIDQTNKEEEEAAHPAYDLTHFGSDG